MQTPDIAEQPTQTPMICLTGDIYDGITEVCLEDAKTGKAVLPYIYEEEGTKFIVGYRGAVEPQEVMRVADTPEERVAQMIDAGMLCHGCAKCLPTIEIRVAQGDDRELAIYLCDKCHWKAKVNRQKQARKNRIKTSKVNTPARRDVKARRKKDKNNRRRGGKH